MLDEIKKIVKIAAHDPKYAALWKKTIILLAVFMALLLANRFLLIGLADKGEFFIQLQRAKVSLGGDTSVYNAAIVPTGSDLKILGLDRLEAGRFHLPLFSLIFYLPFTLIKDFNWSLALWLSTNQVIAYFILAVSLKILNKKVPEKFQIVGASLLLLIYFILINILNANLSLIQIFLILLAFLKIRKNDYIFSGILLGLAFSNPFELFLPLAMIFILNVHNRRAKVNSWLLISMALLALAFVIFDTRWLLEWLKTLLLEREIYPFISYRQYINSVFPRINTSLVELGPILITMWIVIEWLRTPKDNYLQEMWLLSLAFTLAPLLTMWDNPYALAGYLFVLIYNVSLWYERATPKFRLFSAGIHAGLLIILPLAQMILKHRLLNNPEMYVYNLVFTLLLLLNLYWVRLWVMNPYYSVNKLDEL